MTTRTALVRRSYLAWTPQRVLPVARTAATSVTQFRHHCSALAWAARSTQLERDSLSGCASHCSSLRWLSSSAESSESSSTRLDATVEEDLDAALDDLLGEGIPEAVKSRSRSSPFDIPGSKSSRYRLLTEKVADASQPRQEAPKMMNAIRPRKNVETWTGQDVPAKESPEKAIFKDPEFLSTSNPRWVQAGLSPAVIDVLSTKGITKFTPVQAEAFDPIMAGRDLIGRSRTGTGKTLAFGLPCLTRLVDWTQKSGKRNQDGRMSRGRRTSMLVLCPTRELARQVQDELVQVADPLGLFVTVFHGGVSYDPQTRALRDGVDCIVGTPGRIIDHLNRGSLDLSECEMVVLDEADEMLNMGFADDVEIILKGIGSANNHKTQCLLFSATTPPWVKQIARQYQDDVYVIDSTGTDGGARVATTVRHLAVQVPPGAESKWAVLEDIIAVEISKDATDDSSASSSDGALESNPLAAAAAAKKKKNSMQQKIFGKTIVFTETKREADELASGAVFKSLTVQALHGDVGQKQRDATLNAFRAGAFNVLVATDVAARGIDIQDVDLVVQMDPPRDVDAYVHRSGRTGRAGRKGVSVLLFNRGQSRDISRIEKDLGHGFKFELVGPPSIESVLKAVAKTTAIASRLVPSNTAQYFKEAAASLLSEGESPEDVVARCLAAISRRHAEVESRSLLTGEVGLVTVKMTNENGKPVGVHDVTLTVGKLSRSSRYDGKPAFDGDVSKIQTNPENGSAFFDMGVEDAKRLVEFSKEADTGGAIFSLLDKLDVERDHHFDLSNRSGRSGGYSGGRNDRGGSFSRGKDSFNRGRDSFSRGGDSFNRGRDSFSQGGSSSRFGLTTRDSRSGGARYQSSMSGNKLHQKSPRPNKEGRESGRDDAFSGRYNSRKETNDEW